MFHYSLNRFFGREFLKGVFLSATVSGIYYWNCKKDGTLKCRSKLLSNLKATREFDILVVGGGATGAGVAVDAVSRGLSVALVERGDYAGATSSKSTKLIHGGVRYLQNAVFNLDIQEYYLVREALKERKNLMDSAPHLTNPIPIMLPIYTWFDIPFFWVGLKAYDLISGTNFFRSSYYLSRQKTIDEFPLIKRDKLKGSIVYYDGQQDDARMNLNLIQTAISNGAVSLNYINVTSVKKSETKNGPIMVSLKDMITGEEFQCKCKVLVNATGPFTDELRQMYDPTSKKVCSGSSGTHIVIPRYLCPKSMGLLDPKTTDNRVLFLIPWLNHVIAGTTDQKCQIVESPQPTQSEIDFIVSELNKSFDGEFDIMSVWSGIRPLITDPNNKDGTTSKISRNHVIEVKDNFVTIAGGKWTTYRAMAEHTNDTVLSILQSNFNDVLHTKKKDIKFYGTENWSQTHFVWLIQKYNIDYDIAKHLSTSFGMAATSVIKICSDNSDGRHKMNRLHPEYPYTDEEIRYCCRYEYVCSAVDVIARRLRFAFLNADAAMSCLQRVVDIVSEELNWDEDKKLEQYNLAKEYINKETGLELLNKQKETN